MGRRTPEFLGFQPDESRARAKTFDELMRINPDCESNAAIEGFRTRELPE